MHPYIYFNLLGQEVYIPAYNLLIGVALIFAFLNLDCQFKKFKLNDKVLDRLYIVLVITIIFSFISSAVFSNIVHSKYLGQDTKPLFTGFTFLGGFTGGFIFFLIFYFIFIKDKNNLIHYCNILITSVVLGHFWGRMGCYFAGCCFGRETDSFMGIAFPVDSIPYAFYSQSVRIYPTQLFEAAFLICLYVILIKNIKYALSLYFLCYGAFRFFIEFLRGDDRGAILPFLSPSQCIAVIMIILGVCLIRKKSTTYSTK